MYESEVCPKCSARFAARDALVSGGAVVTAGLFIAFPGVSAAVRCPGCSHTFESRTIRFFGFLSPNALKWSLVAAVVLGVSFLVASSL